MDTRRVSVATWTELRQSPATLGLFRRGICRVSFALRGGLTLAIMNCRQNELLGCISSVTLNCALPRTLLVTMALYPLSNHGAHPSTLLVIMLLFPLPS